MRVVALPKLQELGLKDAPKNMVRFLQCLTFPATTSVSLRSIIDTCAFVPGMFAVALPFDRSKVPVLANVQFVSVTVRRLDLTIDCATLPPTDSGRAPFSWHGVFPDSQRLPAPVSSL